MVHAGFSTLAPDQSVSQTASNVDEPNVPVAATSALEEDTHKAKKQLPIEPIPIKPVESYKHTEEAIQPGYRQSKPMSHSPKISPSSIPNPNPSVISTKQGDSGYVSVGGYPFSIPGYSAFQPVTHAIITHSTNPTTANSLEMVKSQSDQAPINHANASGPPVAPITPFSMSSQASTHTSIQPFSSMPLTSTYSSAPPITTAASIGALPQITSVLAMPPNSTMASEPLSTSQSKSVETTQHLDQCTSPRPRIPLPSPIHRIPSGHSMPSKVLTPSTMSSEPSMQGTPPSMQVLVSSKSPIQRVSSEHSHIHSDLLMQSIAQEHSSASVATVPSTMQQPIQLSTPSDSSVQQSSLQHSLSSIPKITSNAVLQRIQLEHSISSNSSIQQLPAASSTILIEPMQRTISSVPTIPSPQQQTTAEHPSLPIPSLETQNMPPDVMPSDSMQGVPPEHYIRSISPNMLPQGNEQRLPLETSICSKPITASEEPLQRTYTLTSDMTSEPSKQHVLPMEHSMPSIPNMPSNSSMQRMHLDYYMPSLPMMPPELIMRRMQLLQYMQSLQTISSEPSLTLMSNMPAYGMAMPQADAIPSMETFSLESSMQVKPADPVVLHRQSIPTMSSHPMALMRSTLEAQSISSNSTVTSEAASIISPIYNLKPIDMKPSESPQKLSTLSSEQSETSTQITQPIQASSSSMTADLLRKSVSLTAPTLHVLERSSAPSMPNKTDRSIPIIQNGIVASDQSPTSTAQQMQMVQLDPSVPKIATEMSPSCMPNTIRMTSSHPSLGQSVFSASNELSQSINTSITQVPIVQSMPYESTILSDTRQFQAMSSIAPSPSVAMLTSNDVTQTTPLVSSMMSSNKLLPTSHLQVVQPLVSMDQTQPTSPILSSMTSRPQPHMQTSVSSDPAKQQMYFVRPLQIESKMEIDKSLLHNQLESSTHVKALKQPMSMSLKQSVESASSLQNYRINSAQTMQSVTSISSAPFSASTPQLPLSTMPHRSHVHVQLAQNMPLMAITESNPKDLTPPMSLVKSMSSMTLTSPIRSTQSTSLMDSTPKVTDSLQVMSSGKSIPAKHPEILTPHVTSVSYDTTNELLSVIDDHSPEHSQTQCRTNLEDHLRSDICFNAAKSGDVGSTKHVSLLSQTVQEDVKEIPKQVIANEMKRKPLERFSLKTSIPISKIDMKCVPNPPDVAFQNPLTKKITFNASTATNAPRNEKQIQGNVLIRGAGIISKDDEYKSIIPSNHNLTTLISAAEAISLKDNQFRRPEPKVDLAKQANPVGSKLNHTSFSHTENKEASKPGSQSSSVDKSYTDQKNQIVFIQNKSSTNKKMILTIKQQNPRLLLKRKNLNSPSRLSKQLKKCKGESVTITEHIPSKVVALKRLHQGDLDEDDFENLITENQIYGNKIVVKEKIQGTSQEQDLKLKTNKTNPEPTHTDTKNVVKPPNFVYLSNIKYSPNVMMYKNNIKSTIDKDSKITLDEKKVNQSHNILNKLNDINIKSVTLNNVPVTKDNHVTNASINTMTITSNNEKVTSNPKVIEHSLKIVNNNNTRSEFAVNPTITRQNFNKPILKSIEPIKVNDDNILNTQNPLESHFQPKVIITDVMFNRTSAAEEEEVSSLDIYEKRKRLRRERYLSNREAKDIQKSETKKLLTNGRYIITPEKIKAEIYKEFASTRLKIEDETGDIESDYEEDELKEYESLIENFSLSKTVDYGKTEFLSNFMLGTQETFKELLWNKRERMIQRDKIASAYIAAGRLDRLTDEETSKEVIKAPNQLISGSINHGVLNENGSDFNKKQMFLSQLNLKHVKPRQRARYETIWQEILKERKRRDAHSHSNHVFKQPRMQKEKVEINTNSDLQLLTEIKNCVTENNNLIKKRLDLSCENDGDSIKTLTEKNFSELNRLSMMADRSVKHFSGQDTKKRDLNPGFDSENIQNPARKLDLPINYPNITIPNISKIISLKTTSEPSAVTSSQATSMDEPQNSAAGVDEMFSEANIDKTKEIDCQTEQTAWPGVEEMIRIYRDFEKARKKEAIELTRRSTALKVEGAHITRNASRQSDRARALLAERRHLSLEEGAVKQAIQRLFNAVDVVRNYF